MQHHPKQLLAYIKERKDEFVSLVEALVSIETPPSHPDHQVELIQLLIKQLREIDFYTRHLAGNNSGGQLYARPTNRKHGAPNQLLIGHCDTAWPLETLERMPFSFRQGTITGPGSYDMKTGIAMMLMALKTLKHFNIQPSLTPVVFIYSDEIAGTPESRPTIERLARYADRAFILEPSKEKSGEIFTSSMGFGNFHIRIRNNSSSTDFMSESGNGAMLELSQAVQRFYDLNDPDRDIYIEVSEIDDGMRSNILTGEHQANVQVRLGNPDDISFIEERAYEIESTTSGVDISIEGGIYRPPMLQNERNYQLWSKVERLADRLGIPLNHSRREKASVATITNPYTATIDGLGPVGLGAFSYRESVDLDRTLERCALLTLLLSID